MTTVFAPFTIHDVMTLLPGLRERALKEELRKHGCYIKDSKPMLVTLDQFQRFLKVNEVKKAEPKPAIVGAPGFIYFVACDLDGETLVKIGYATNVGARLSGLQVASPAKLRLLATIPGSKQRERKIHAHFARFRQRGEWFALTEEDLRGIERLNHG